MYKFHIIKSIPITRKIQLPQFVLAESQKQAEIIYKDFAGVLNRMSYKYSQFTGIEKSDLFGEAVLGLAIAYKNWTQKYNILPKKTSKGFKTYAIFSIKDSLNEYVRHNSSNVKIPSYLMKSINNFKKFNNYLENVGIEKKIITQIINNEDITSIKSFLTKDDIKKVDLVLKNLIFAAKRASITLKELYVRNNLINSCDINIENTNNSNKSNEEEINTAILINNLKSKMDKNELLISNYIMEGYSIPEIGKLMGKKTHWVRYKLKKIKERTLNKLEE